MRLNAKTRGILVKAGCAFILLCSYWFFAFGTLDFSEWDPAVFAIKFLFISAGLLYIANWIRIFVPRVIKALKREIRGKRE